MTRELIKRNNSHISKVVSVSIEGTDTVLLTIEGENQDKAILELDVIGANGLRIAISSLQDIPPHILPKNILGDYQCHYIHILYNAEGIEFEKENGETIPFGKYYEIEDGLIAFNNEEILWVCVSCKNAKVCTLDESKEYLVFEIPKEILEETRKPMNKIFPFNRFGKDNKLSYGYFHTVKEE